MMSTDLKWLNEILADAMVLSKEKGMEASKKYQSTINNIDSEDYDPLNDTHEMLIKYTLHFDYITLHSLFVSAYSIFENFMLNFGSIAENVSASKIKISDLNSKGGEVERVRKYFDLVHNLGKANIQDPQWTNLVKYQKVRNLIVHNRSMLVTKSSNNDNLKPFLERYNTYIKATSEFQIRDKQFLEGFTINASWFAHSLAAECDASFNIA